MKILRTTVLVLFIIVFALFCIISFQKRNADSTYPKITVTDDVLEVSISATDAELLAGVTAYDEKDGDLTNKIIVESVSRFTEKGVCVVSYAVCDSDNHTASATRKIVYSDYESPRFTLSGSLVFGVSQSINIRNLIGVTDSIDGNIDSKVIITANEYVSGTVGINYISVSATNSKGDTITLQLPVYIEQLSLSAPDITLHQYMLYCKVGDSFDINENVVECVDYNGNDISADITVDTNLDLSTPGLYEVHYRVKDAADREGHAITFVVVEE